MSLRPSKKEEREAALEVDVAAAGIPEERQCRVCHRFGLVFDINMSFDGENVVCFDHVTVVTECDVEEGSEKCGRPGVHFLEVEDDHFDIPIRVVVCGEHWAELEKMKWSRVQCHEFPSCFHRRAEGATVGECSANWRCDKWAPNAKEWARFLVEHPLPAGLSPTDSCGVVRADSDQSVGAYAYLACEKPHSK